MLKATIRKFLVPEMLFGRGSRKLVGQYSKNLGITKVLIVTDQGIIRAGWLKDVMTSLEEHNVDYVVFQQVSPNPRDYEVMEGVQVYENEKCNGIIALGGGSPMDCAKGIGIVATNEKDILYFLGVDKINAPMPPLICIPTTSGTSSDVSQFANILDSKEKLKTVIISKAIVPDISLIDPETTSTMDSFLIATTGIDALVHAIEAFVSKGRSSFTDIHALEAIKLIVKYLPIRYNDPQNLDALEKMMLASTEAGMAFSNAILGAVHSMSHSLGGFLDLSHGECNSMLINSTISFNYDSEPARFDVIAEAFGLNFKNETSKERKKALIEKIMEFKTNLGIVRKLENVGIKSCDIPLLAKNAYIDPSHITNPKKVSVRDIEVIYEESM
ncbi:alcohol dehydrogenase-like regulatory protein ErcA [Clostridium sp.]|uniref:alcohol dehydrogenase-like regulatory protein ErcA n=1 Tax=Clostridium sp. TaxID=1506 RepID=UPI002845BE7D|nr:alcohol dehydrogenase-like regulatory protein ErcA [Clostridium sp.]MDR3594775.1 iron-containing alcohol dehydrogenase [Clostridium sp.]